MPTLPLFIRRVPLTQHQGTPQAVSFPDGNIPVAPPLADPAMPRVLNRRLGCLLRFPPSSGAVDGVLDTGAPLTIIPRFLWQDRFHWEPDRHFDVCEIAGVGPVLGGQVLRHGYSFRLARLRVPLELFGTDLTTCLRIENAVVQLADLDAASLRFVILGVWGGVFEGRQLRVDHPEGSDDLSAQLEW